MISATS